MAFWNADKHAYEAISFSHRQWWLQLPFLEIISRSEAEERYGMALNAHSWLQAASATRGTASLILSRHMHFWSCNSFGEGRYAIYDFGKFARKYPATRLESLAIFCHNLQATVAYPDENVFYSNPQQACKAFAIAPQEGKALM